MTREKAETKRIAGPDMLGNGKGKMSWCETKGITKGGGVPKKRENAIFVLYFKDITHKTRSYNPPAPLAAIYLIFFHSSLCCIL